MNAGSVMAWVDYESEVDMKKNLLRCPPELRLEYSPGKMITLPLAAPNPRPAWRDRESPGKLYGHTILFSDMTIALIAHDEMKARMTEFVIDHERELRMFGTILATGTTGREVAAATSKEIDGKMVRHHSGPKGGDIEIATAILYKYCDVVIFFVDPLKPHPHIEDIRVVFQACMVSDQVVMITNEMHAREFMSRMVRGRDKLTLYYPDAPAPKA
jgi:methylglyoxal synthase